MFSADAFRACISFSSACTWSMRGRRVCTVRTSASALFFAASGAALLDGASELLQTLRLSKPNSFFHHPMYIPKMNTPSNKATTPRITHQVSIFFLTRQKPTLVETSAGLWTSTSGESGTHAGTSKRGCTTGD